MNIFDRIENVRKTLRLNKGEVCERLGIGRTMLHYVKTGERELGSQNMRALELLEQEARIKKASADADQAGGSDQVMEENLIKYQADNFQQLYFQEKARADALQKQLCKTRRGLIKIIEQLGEKEP